MSPKGNKRSSVMGLKLLLAWIGFAICLAIVFVGLTQGFNLNIEFGGSGNYDFFDWYVNPLNPLSPFNPFKP